MIEFFEKPELLAPAGKRDVFYEVIEAGADAVYLSGKHFNMRRHRKDFHFENEDLSAVCEYAHLKNKKVYVTVNILLSDNEVELLVDYLKFLEDIKVDAIIVNDLAVLQICLENSINIPLHASTMMNVNSVEHAAVLKKFGFTRVVTSRDITIDEVRRIKSAAGIEVEYFIHGDMCTAQSGQCHGSGIIFGKSSNRGQCMKPCRWSYDLVALKSGDLLKKGEYLLASKDMCVIEHIPEFIDAGISSFKIEGRMKSKDILVPIISAYRKAIDSYLSNPMEYKRDFDSIRNISNNRVRDLTTGFSFKTPSSDYIDISGEREPVFLSYSGKQKLIEDYYIDSFEDNVSKPNRNIIPELSCVVGTYPAAKSAIESGADNIIISWEGDLKINSSWKSEEINNLISLAGQNNKKIILTTPRILTERELKEFYKTVTFFDKIDTFLINGIAPVEFLQERGKNIWADYLCNIINSKSARFFADLGIKRIMPSIEASFKTISDIIQNSPDMEFDIQVHGMLLFMLVEHCIVSMNLQQISKKDFCKMPCINDEYLIVDRSGQKRIIKTDKYCRNHIIMQNDLAVLPSIKSFLSLGAKSFRIDARLYDAEKVSFLINVYKKAIKNPDDIDNLVDEFRTFLNNEEFSYGAYIKGISEDDKLSLLSLKKEENYV